MKYKIKRLCYDDEVKSPLWTIIIYKNGKSFDVLKTQYSSFWEVFKNWIEATLFC